MPLTYPDELDGELRLILGFPNFKAGPLAQVFRDAGDEIPPKAEEEQAFVLDKMLRLYLTHGKDDWWAVFVKEHNDALDRGQPTRDARKAKREAAHGNASRRSADICGND